MIDSTFLNLRAPEFLADPYPFYEALRRDDPVHRSANGFWMISRYRDVQDALRHDSLGNEPSRFAVVNPRNREKYVAADVANNIIPFMDPPQHTPARRLIAKAFRSRLADLSFDLEGLATDLLDGFRDHGEFDLINDFGTPFSIIVICRFIGFPERDATLLKSWSDGFFYLFNPIPSPEVLDRVNRDLAAFRDYAGQIVESRRRQASDDFISRLVEADDDSYRLSTAEIIDTCMLIFADGVENVDSGIGNCALELLQAELIPALVEDGDRIPHAIEECLRINPPAQFVARVAKADFEFRGAMIKKHHTVFLGFASANRDPEVFPEPDKLDISRQNNRHMAFGLGRHSCLGGALVTLEFQAAFRAIFAKLDGLRLIPDERRWIDRMGHRWLETLRVEFTPDGPL